MSTANLIIANLVQEPTSNPAPISKSHSPRIAFVNSAGRSEEATRTLGVYGWFGGFILIAVIRIDVALN